MAHRIAVSFTASAIVATSLSLSVRTVAANPMTNLSSFDASRILQITPSGEMHATITASPSIFERNVNSERLAYEAFDATKFKTTFDRDPNFLAWATRKNAFFQFLIENDLIGMTRDKVTEMFGEGQPLQDAPLLKNANDNAGNPNNFRPCYILVTKITGAKVVATCIQLEYKNDKVARWRMFSSTNPYPIAAPKDMFRSDLASHWVNQNVVESDICDFGLKYKKSLEFLIPDKSNDSFESTRPTFDVMLQKVLPSTEEPVALILLPKNPTSAEFLDAANLCQQSLLVKASREYTIQAIATAKNDADRKKAKAFLDTRLPLKTPSWTVQKRHLEAYAASKRKEPEAAFAGCEKNIRDEPAFEYPYYMIGMLKREQQNFAGAGDMFERVLKINPKYQRALFGLASIRMQAGDSTLARKMALQAYFLYPYDSSSKSIYRLVVGEDPPEKEPAGLYGAAKTVPSKMPTKKHVM